MFNLDSTDAMSTLLGAHKNNYLSFRFTRLILHMSTINLQSTMVTPEMSLEMQQ